MQGWMDDEYEPSLEYCQVWLTQREKEREKTERREQHEVWIGLLLDSVEGGAGVLHSITKSRPWRGGFTNY